jgi:RimJ/RimL family protein N-acetyltransferase
MSASPDPSFTTARMLLRPVAATDLNAFIELDSDPEVMRFITGGKAHTLSDYKGGLLDRMMAYLGQPFGFFSAFGRETESFLGWFHLRPSVADETMLELGYRLRRPSWGRGLATEGGEALLAYAFGALGEQAVDACTMPENQASIAVMRKLGMEYRGLITHPRVEAKLARYLVDAAAWSRRSLPSGSDA